MEDLDLAGLWTLTHCTGRKAGGEATEQGACQIQWGSNMEVFGYFFYSLNSFLNIYFLVIRHYTKHQALCQILGKQL